MAFWKKDRPKEELQPMQSKEFQFLTNENIMLNKKIEDLIARFNSMEDTLKKFRQRVYREDRAEAEDSNNQPGMLLPYEPPQRSK